MFGPATTEFLPGAYRLNEATGQLTPLCLPSNGSWVKPGGGKCPLQAGNTAPPAATRYQMGLQLPAGVSWVVGNLGINTAQWQVAGNATGLLGAIGRSVQLTRVATAAPVFQYSFNGATLPSALDKEIPGGGIFMHMQDILAGQPGTYPFARPGQALQVDARLGLASYQAMGGATLGVTIGLSFQAPNAQGQLAPIILLVSLFNSKGLYREHTATDGRNIYAASAFTNSPAFITPISSMQLTPDQRATTFSFKMTGANMASLIAALNVYLVKESQSPLSMDLRLVRLHQVDLRNEVGRLDKGVVHFIFSAEFLRAYYVRR